MGAHVARGVERPRAPTMPARALVRVPGGLSRAARVLMRSRLFEGAKTASSVSLVVGVELVVGPRLLLRDKVLRVYPRVPYT